MLTNEQVLKALKTRSERAAVIGSDYSQEALDRATAREGQYKMFAEWAERWAGKMGPPFDPNSAEWAEELSQFLA